MTWAWIAGGALVVFIVFAVVMTRENRRDDEDDPWDPFPPQRHPGFGDIPRYPEIAHDEYRPVQRFHETSPAALPPPSRREADYTGSAVPPPGTAAAAGKATPPPATPPPLPHLTAPTAPALAILGAVIAGLQDTRDRAWQDEVLAPFPPDVPWMSDDTIDRMHAIKDAAP